MPIQDWSERIVIVDLHDDPQFTDDMTALTDLIEKRNGADVLLNLADVNFLNSSNIAKLLKLRKQLHSNYPGKLRLCGISNSVWGVFLVTGLDKIFEFADDVASGLAGLQMQR
ncbi:MAG: STAS domain-containing protein [Phycisphaerae bacterium]|nr:STAS domain-containing protein [Phycisphaerae bacterium]